MRGEISWSAGDLRDPAGPANPIPANLWRAPAGSLPAAGNYLYLQPEAGAFVTPMTPLLLTAQESNFAVGTYTPMGTEAFLGLRAETLKGERWAGEFQAMLGLAKFQTGYYPRILQWATRNRAFGGMTWSGNGRGCNGSSGWYAIDKVTYVGDALTAIHLRFEFHCENQQAALYGELNWEAPPVVVAAAQEKLRMRGARQTTDVR
jgi:hypothetical protein